MLKTNKNNYKNKNINNNVYNTMNDYDYNNKHNV
jgi:hypothetical protein